MITSNNDNISKLHFFSSIREFLNEFNSRVSEYGFWTEKTWIYHFYHRFVFLFPRIIDLDVLSERLSSILVKNGYKVLKKKIDNSSYFIYAERTPFLTTVVACECGKTICLLGLTSPKNIFRFWLPIIAPIITAFLLAQLAYSITYTLRFSVQIYILSTIILAPIITFYLPYKITVDVGESLATQIHTLLKRSVAPIEYKGDMPIKFKQRASIYHLTDVLKKIQYKNSP